MMAGVFALFENKVSAQSEPEVLVVAIQQDMPDFNTWNLASNGAWKSDVINWGFEGLVGLDYDMLPFPVIAESWTFDEPSLTWTFHIRHGVTFHDGTPLTADDVVFIYKAARAGTTYSGDIINAFDSDSDGVVSQAEIDSGVIKVDSFTVDLVMANPYGEFLSTTATIPIMPKAIWQNHLNGDGTLDVLWGNDPRATVSTGPWMYKEGIPNTYRIMEKYTDYWGKNATTPLGYRLYPAHIDQLYFRVTPTMDSAILALQSGLVDYISWPVTAGRVPSLQADPNVGLRYLPDNGYFYLAFNEKFDPMGDISFRRAVSDLIDKDQIVNVYMGGLGVKGSACEPPLWGTWFNESVQTWPFDATLATSNNTLDAAGYLDVNGDGWRELPGGAPMQKITILTPPADYDPVRIRAGEMIAKNMRQVGINSEAQAVDFETLVSRLQSMDYQMLIIGWSLSSEPVGNVFDILGPMASWNTFGFWSLAHPNPFYKDLLGVNTRADSLTQQLADDVYDLGTLAKSSFDMGSQVLFTRWAEGVIAEAIPVNVLYYRVNVEAYWNSWVGWYPFMGTLFNRFSIGYLEDTGAPAGLQEANALLNAALSMPEKVGIGGAVDAYVTVIDDSGRPVSGASVSIDVAGYGLGPASVSIDSSIGITDPGGICEFLVTGLSRGYSNITVMVTKGSESSVAAGMIQSVGEVPQTLVLGVAPESLVLQPGESTVVHLNVSDENGLPVEGATISVDPNLISYGWVDSEQVVTDASGEASMTYTAPAAILELNAHLEVTLSYAVSKAGYMWTDSSAVNLLIYNSLAPLWVMAQVDSVGTTALTRAANATTVTVLAVDDEGNPLAEHRMAVTYSDMNAVFSPVGSVLTDGSGVAIFDVQLKDSASSFGLRVTICNATVLNSVPATITLTHAGSGPVPAMYGGYMTWDTQYLIPDAAHDYVEATAHVWDETGAAADGINASLLVSGTPYGSLVWNDYIMWDSTYDGWGINIVTDKDKANLVTSGPFTTYFDYANWEQWYNGGYIYWNWADNVMVPVDITAGTVTIGIYTQDWAPVDLLGSVYLIPGGTGSFNGTTLSYEINGPTTISGNYVIGRSYTVATPKYYIEKPVMEARLADYDVTNVTMWAFDETNAPLGGASVQAYQNVLTGNRDYTVSPSGRIPTDPQGLGTADIIAVGKNNVVTSASLQADVYVRARSLYSVSMFSQSRIFIHTQQCFISMDLIQEVKAIGDMVKVNVTVLDFSGVPIEGMPVELSAGAGNIAVPTMLTGADGRASFDLDTTNVTSAPVGFIPVRASAGGPAYDMSTASMMLAVREVQPPFADAGADTTVTEGDTVYFDGLGSSDNFVVVNYTWNFTYDGSPVLLYGGSPSFVFLIPGTYVVTLNVTDRAGNFDTDVVVITVESVIPEFQTLLLPMTGILAVVVVMRLARTRRN